MSISSVAGEQHMACQNTLTGRQLTYAYRAPGTGVEDLEGAGHASANLHQRRPQSHVQLLPCKTQNLTAISILERRDKILHSWRLLQV